MPVGHDILMRILSAPGGKVTGARASEWRKPRALVGARALHHQPRPL